MSHQDQVLPRSAGVVQDQICTHEYTITDDQASTVQAQVTMLPERPSGSLDAVMVCLTCLAIAMLFLAILDSRTSKDPRRCIYQHLCPRIA